jgi:2-hydroxychromene-2-carboxylate isomerase
MSQAQIDYYLAPNSPWAYLGHARLVAMARAAGAHVSVKPMDLGGRVFAATGGVPLPQRAPARQAYRLAELRRYSAHLQMPLHLKPTYFPVAADAASKLIIAVRQADGDDAALKITGALLAAVWAQQRNIADAATLGALLCEADLPADRLAQSEATAVQAELDANTQAALDAGVFGAPSYVVTRGAQTELFWGQDRLDFVQRMIAP